MAIFLLSSAPRTGPKHETKVDGLLIRGEERVFNESGLRVREPASVRHTEAGWRRAFGSSVRGTRRPVASHVARPDELVPAGIAADLERLGHVTRTRVTQIVNLLSLAPNIQEQILFWPAVHGGKDPISERGLRSVVTELDWKKQWMLWTQLSRMS
jgi:hypothetical protein